MKRSAAVLFVALAVGGVAAGAERKTLTPIIARLVSEPERYVGKSVRIYGLVIESRSAGRVFMLQDVSQHPLEVVGNDSLKAAVGDQVTVVGTFRLLNHKPHIAADRLIPTRVLGGGGCC